MAQADLVMKKHSFILFALVFTATVNAQTYYGTNALHLSTTPAGAESFAASLATQQKDGAEVFPLPVFWSTPGAGSAVSWAVAFTDGTLDEIACDYTSPMVTEPAARISICGGLGSSGLGSWNIASFTTEAAAASFKNSLATQQILTARRWKAIGTGQYASNVYVVAYQGLSAECP